MLVSAPGNCNQNKWCRQGSERRVRCDLCRTSVPQAAQGQGRPGPARATLPPVTWPCRSTVAAHARVTASAAASRTLAEHAAGTPLLGLALESSSSSRVRRGRAERDAVPGSAPYPRVVLRCCSARSCLLRSRQSRSTKRRRHSCLVPCTFWPRSLSSCCARQNTRKNACIDRSPWSIFMIKIPFTLHFHFSPGGRRRGGVCEGVRDARAYFGEDTNELEHESIDVSEICNPPNIKRDYGTLPLATHLHFIARQVAVRVGQRVRLPFVLHRNHLETRVFLSSAVVVVRLCATPAVFGLIRRAVFRLRGTLVVVCAVRRAAVRLCGTRCVAIDLRGALRANLGVPGMSRGARWSTAVAVSSRTRELRSLICKRSMDASQHVLPPS